jgi:hypothetical protein
MVNKALLAIGAAALMGVATPANATFWCWIGGKCGNSSSGGHGGSSGGGSSNGGSSGGGATPVPEPEQMALFGIGAAVLAARVLRGNRKAK